MDAMIERLRREKAEVDAKNKHAAQEQGSKNNADFSAGKTAGIEWAKNAPYMELTLYNKGGLPEAESFRKSAIRRDIMRKKGKSLQWAEGWMEGVSEFWQEIKGKL